MRMKAPAGMDQAVMKWLVKTARRNFWRVQRWYEFDDLVQDGLMCWCRVIAKYGADRDPPHLTALFKTTFSNHITDLARKRTSMPDPNPANIDDDAVRFLVDFRHADVELLLTNSVGKQGPAADILMALSTDEGAARYRSFQGRRENNTRMTTNEKFCRLVGVDPDGFDAISALREFLTS